MHQCNPTVATLVPAEGKDILDFYSDPAARALYKLHIWGLLSRLNPLTGLALKDDPAIFSFNIINEPRCPGRLNNDAALTKCGPCNEPCDSPMD